ncbi:MAG: hypothetical protein CMC89_02910 [Flavobacteriaceae bacterium]|nr:hypothetical protein [Flavobacteriaceae bacterium]
MTLKLANLAGERKVKVEPIQPVGRLKGYPRKHQRQLKKCQQKKKPDLKKKKLLAKEFHTVIKEKE